MSYLILRLKCTNFHSAPPDPLAGFEGPTSKGRKGSGMGKGEGERIKGRGEEGLEPPLLQIYGYATDFTQHLVTLYTVGD